MADNLTADQFWSDLVAAHKLEAPPEGALCVVEFAARTGQSEKHTRDILNGYVNKGVMQCGEFRKPGTGKRATYYWPA